MVNPHTKRAHLKNCAKRSARYGVGVNLFSDSSLKTKKLGEILGKEILKAKKTKRAPKDRALNTLSARPTGQALILGLEGDLGGGKTTFLQGFAKGLGIKQRITSPTFVIMKKFPISNSQFLTFYHIDCYRLQKPKEILFLGFKEIISNPKNIVAIEWADRIRRLLPKDALILKFKFVDQNRREIKVNKAHDVIKKFFLLRSF